MEQGHIRLADLDRQEAVRRIAKSQAELLGLTWRLAVRTGLYARLLVVRGYSAAYALIQAREYAKEILQDKEAWI